MPRHTRGPIKWPKVLSQLHILAPDADQGLAVGGPRRPALGLESLDNNQDDYSFKKPGWAAAGPQDRQLGPPGGALNSRSYRAIWAMERQS